MFISLYDIPLVLFWLFISLWIIRRLNFFKHSGLSPQFLYSVFFLKILAGTVMAALYTYYYTDRSTADIFKYFDDSKLMSDALWHKPGDFFRMLFGFDNDNTYFSEHYYNHMNNWFRKYESNLYNDSHTIIRINAVMRIFSFGSYHVHTIFACMFSMAGLVGIYRAFKSFFIGKERYLSWFIFLWPSVLFWGSGVLKEAFLLFGIGILFVALLDAEMKSKSFRVFCFVLGLVLLLYLKVYVLMALLPGLISFLILRKRKMDRPLIVYVSVFLLCVLAWNYFEYLFPSYHMKEILVQKREDFIRLSESMNSGSLIYTMPLENNFLSFLQAAPLALLNVLFRPFPLESLSPLILIASLENAIILLALVLWVFRFDPQLLTQRNLFWMLLIFVVALFVLIGWVTPVMGAIVRYKVPGLPFLGMLLLMGMRPPSISRT